MMKTLFTIFISFAIALLLSSCQKAIEQTENEGLPKCNIKGRIDSSGEYKVTVDKDCDTEFYSQSLLKGLNYEVEQNVSNSSISTLTNVGTPLQTKSNNTKPPYTLEQIEAHLREMYREEIKNKKGLKRWEQKPIKYYISNSLSERITKNNLSTVDKLFQELSILANIQIKQHTSKISKGSNISIIFTDDFFKTMKRKTTRRLFYYGRSDKSFIKFINQLKEKNINAYTVAYNISSDKIDKSYTLLEVTPERHANFKHWMYFILFAEIAIGSIQSDLIKPSVTNFSEDKYKEGEKKYKLEPIDKAFLKALYSDKVYYDQPLDEAIPILSKAIYQQLNK